MNAVDILQGVAALLAFVAAYFWFKSAAVRVPDFAKIHTFVDGLGQLTPAGVWATETAKFNKWGAGFAAGAAFLGGLSILIKFVC